MIIKLKNLFLKKDIDKELLEFYGFETLNNGYSYWKDIGEWDLIGWYSDTRRFVFKYPKNYNPKKILKYINIPNEYLEVKYLYMWLQIFGSWQNLSEKKKVKIKERLERLNNDCR